jgi:arylsulfatase A-like enzyme
MKFWLTSRLLLSIAVLPTLLVAPKPAASQSNVVVIISDDAGWADYGFMRNAVSAADPGNSGAVPTPNLDALAARGVTFTNAYTGSVCSVSRAMITTGQYGTRFGYGLNIAGSDTTPINNAATVQGLPTNITTIWERMQSAAYDTAAVGKWHLGQHANGGGLLGNRPENQGIEFFQGLWGGSRNYTVGDVTGSGQLRETISDGAGGIISNNSIESNYSGQYVTDVFGDQSAEYIRNQAEGSPFFLYSSFTAPHTPMQATATDLAFIDSLGEPAFSGNRRTYAAMQYAMDRNVGKIMAALEDPAGDGTDAGHDSDNILDETLIVFINDNGGDCCDSGPNASDNGALRNGKGSQFEGGMRVPMIIAGAGVNASAAGSVSTDLVHSVDIVPTALIGAAGGSFGPDDVIDGVNLLPYINGTANTPHHDLFINRYSNQQSAVRMGQWKYMYQTGPGYQLYDLDADIGESNNLAGNPANAATVQQLHQLMASYQVQMDKPRHDNQADDTNQFDHFRFREDSFAAAAFSSQNAWTNGATGTGSFTASWRDGYANNELTFRTKPSGDYTVTNDLTSAGGFAYMANRINLVSQAAPLTTARTATINGQPVMMVNRLDGMGPTVNLDATDAMAKTFTFNVDHDIEVYDDLTIQGNGNQKFVINGQLREFRAGRNVTKIGTSEVTLGGGVDISGNLDVQDGKVAFTNGQVRGHVLARTGTSLVVGGTGFNEQGPAPPAPEIVMTGLSLDYDAASDISGDSLWTEAGGSGSNLSFPSSANVVSVSDPAFPGIRQAYNIPTSGKATGLGDYFEAGGTSAQRSREDATFEVWFHVSDTAAGSEQVIFEGGATRGVSMTLANGTVKFNVDGDGSLLTLADTVGIGWHQAVGVIDLVGASDDLSNDSMSLYVDNTLVGTHNNVLIDDWAGGNNVGIGGDAGGTAGGSPVDYHDNVAIVRYYNDFLFGAAEVDQNFQVALFDPGMGSVVPTRLSIDGDYFQADGATLQIDLLDVATHDAVEVTGTATVDGILEVSAISGFAPTVGDSYTVLTAMGGISGQFAAVELPQVSGIRWQVEYVENTVVINALKGRYHIASERPFRVTPTTVPEPSTGFSLAWFTWMAFFMRGHPGKTLSTGQRK